MSDEHRLELERLAAQIRERSLGGIEDDEGSSLDEWLGLNRLFAVYVRLAVAHHASAASFCAVGRVELSEHVCRLEAMLRGASESSRVWIERRLAIARRRIDA